MRHGKYMQQGTDSRMPLEKDTTAPTFSGSAETFLATLNQLVKFSEKSRHECLEVRLPPAVLHWPSTAAFPDKNWGIVEFRIGCTGTEVSGHIALQEHSDVQQLEINETSWSIAEAHASYVIGGVAMSISDMRQTLAYLLATFHASSVNVTASE